MLFKLNSYIIELQIISIRPSLFVVGYTSNDISHMKDEQYLT